MIKKLILPVLAVAIIATGCGSDSNNKRSSKKAAGGAHYGGVLRVNEVEDFRSLFPLGDNEVTSHRIAGQVYEGLVKLDQKDLSLIPAIAEKWEVNDSATIFTFHLRKGVKFHDDPAFKDGKGREVTAKDFKYCYDLACTDFSENQGFWIFKDRVKGADEFHASSKKSKPAGGVSGIKVIDDYTLQIELNYSFAGFPSLLTTRFGWVFPKEAYEKYGADMRTKCVGTGPFIVKNIKEGEAVVLQRNPDYWGTDEHGNKLPYLDAVKYTFIKEKKAELLEFRQGNIDLVYRLPLEMIKDVTTELENAKEGNINFELQNTAAQSLFFYGFQNQGKIFNNKKVRQAFNYAIDRESLVTYTLQGEGIPALHGVVPPAFAGYDINKIKGYPYNPEMARQLFKEAGYPNGKGFPKLGIQINSGGGDRNVQTAEVIQKMLKENLGIELDINVMPMAQHLETIDAGKADLYRLGWIADYPDPENFLNILYGGNVPTNPNEKSFINSFRYVSPVFDSLFTLARKEIDQAKRYDLFMQAEQVAMDDAALMPIFYDENTRLLQVFVKNCPINAMEYRDFSKVYIDSELKEKYSK